ncbi:MAG: response regulator [Cyclobacteriaceae bacterium]|jgi:two-component system chemotaxis response regulator CheY
MEKLFIILVEDQPEVLRAIASDLQEFEDDFVIEECQSADEAWEVMERIEKRGGYIPLIVSDHVMPNQTGVEFLSRVHRDTRFVHTRRILLTGLATHQDTIRAINQAAIHLYIEKPWKREDLVASAKRLITEYLFDLGIDYQPYQRYLDSGVLLQRMRK